MTLALHGLLLLALFTSPQPMKLLMPPPPPAAEDPVVHIRFYSESEPVHTPEQVVGDNAPAIVEEACGGDFYVGIGIVAGSASGLVLLVAPGAPAARAGIRAGEEILNAEVLGANRYTEGTPLELQVAGTDGLRRMVALRVEKICNA